jgi:hypothetical protein
VYGGGGITPDVWVDPQYLTRFTSQILNQRIVLEYANQYLAAHPTPSTDFATFLDQFQVTDAMLSDFMDLVEKKYGRMLAQNVKRDRSFMDFRSKYERSWDAIQEYVRSAEYEFNGEVRVKFPVDSLRGGLMEKYTLDGDEITEFTTLAVSKATDAVERDFTRDRDFLTNMIRAEIARIWYNGQTYYYQVRVRNDNQVIKAQTLFDEARQIAGLPDGTPLQMR